MANSPQAIKRARQAESRRQRNAAHRSAMRTRVKSVAKAIDSGDKDKAEAAFKLATPLLDKMVNKGIVHKNKVAREKQRLNNLLRAM